MSRRIVTIVISLALIGCFFLTYLQDFSGKASGFEIVTAPIIHGVGKGVLIVKYVWLLFPVSALLLLIGALNNENYFLGRFIWAIVPLLAFCAFLGIVYIDGKRAGAIPEVKEVAAMIGLGLWISLGLSLLQTIWPRTRAAR